MNFLIRLALLLAFLSFPVAGMAQEPQPFQGIFCDTREQIERVVAKGTELGGAQEGIDAVNAEAKLVSADASNACVHTVILGIRGKELNVISTPEGKLAVVAFLVVAVRSPFGMMPMKENTVWFTLASPIGQGV